jgi:hypothetical protein
MARKSRTKIAAAADQTLFDFTLEFFTRAGAVVTKTDRRRKSTLEVALPQELAAYFGAERLDLCFHGVEPAPGQELVSHGSRVFDRMLSYLEQRSAFTVQRLPARYQGTEGLLGAFRPVNSAIRDWKLQESTQTLYAFTWRLTYRADDKRQELHTVLVDDGGTRRPLAAGTAPGIVTDDAVDWEALQQAAEPVSPELNEAGELLPPRLPPVAQLVRLAETARKYAIYHADLRCVAHEAEIMPRLYKTLNRLTGYYQQQIEEIYDTHDPEGDRRRVLESDLQRKIAEEIENHRLRVQVELVGYAVLEVPLATAEIVLSNGGPARAHSAGRTVTVRVEQNRFDGSVRGPHCHACGRPTVAVALDRNGHITCDDCIRQCATCQAIVCAACGTAPCPVCGKENCAACGVLCWVCGERGCAEHVAVCPVCGDAACLACQGECAVCGTRQCRSHLRADHVPAADGSVSLICNSCAIRCPGCRQYTVQVGYCSASGQRFCRNCLTPCAGCGKLYGPGFYTVSTVDRKAYCSACAQECPTCRRVTPQLVACTVCGAQGCPACTPRCVVCDRPFCGHHTRRADLCAHAFCEEHADECAIGHESVCPRCGQTCALCERHYCGHHAAECALCGREYCSECVRVTGLCETCAPLLQDKNWVDIREESWAGLPEIARLAPRYRWVRGHNTRYTIYLGEGTLFTGVVVVAEKRDGEWQVQTRHLSSGERMRGLLGF